MSDHTIELPDGLTWVVRALEFSEERSKEVWEDLQSRYGPGEGNFSCWRTTDPGRARWLVVLCGPKEKLPVVDDGVPYALSEGEARMFALRRARVGLEAVESGTRGHITQINRDEPRTIDPRTGKTVPWHD